MEIALSSPLSADIREMVAVSPAADKAYSELPEDVRETADAALTAIQNNRPLPSSRQTKLSGKLSGITEVKLPFDTNTYRVYHLVEFDDVVYLLDAGMKKSNEKGEIPKWQVETLVARKKDAEADHKANAELYQSRFENRNALRKEKLVANKPRRP